MALFFVTFLFATLFFVTKNNSIKINRSNSITDKVNLINKYDNSVAFVSQVIIGVATTSNNSFALSTSNSFSMFGEIKDPGINMSKYLGSKNISYSNQFFSSSFATRF